MSVDCGHDQVQPGGMVCIHLLEGQNQLWSVARYFTGSGREYYLLCESCARYVDQEIPPFQTVCKNCFDALDDNDWELVVGQPQVLERPSGLSFSHETISMQALLERKILDIQPVNYVSDSVWIALFQNGEVARIDIPQRSILPLFRLPATDFQLSEQASIAFSSDTRWIAITNTRGSEGVVVDASTSQIMMKLNRGTYYPGETPFPVAFFELDNKVYLVHGTAWNRLDVSDPRSGQLLTDRSPTSYQRSEPRPEHYLDYFHSQLLVSPDQEWVAEFGWIWHPVGDVRTWSLRRWVQNNQWESEDGESLRRLSWSSYFWNGPLCWIDNRTLAIWGYGNDDEYMIPSVRLWDVTSGHELRWFPGPEKGLLMFDHYLFSASQNGTDVWDVTTGERLLHDPILCPIRYHRGTRQFLSVLPDGSFRLSRLVETGTE